MDILSYVLFTCTSSETTLKDGAKKAPRMVIGKKWFHLLCVLMHKFIYILLFQASCMISKGKILLSHSLGCSNNILIMVTIATLLESN